MTALLSIDDVRAAARRLSSHVYRTPVLSSEPFDEASGYRVFFKCETLQRAGSFKIRGALNKLLTLTPEEREMAHLLPYVSTARYVGRWGWVTAEVADEESLEAALEWLRESYWLKAPPHLRAAVEEE